MRPTRAYLYDTCTQRIITLLLCIIYYIILLSRNSPRYMCVITIKTVYYKLYRDAQLVTERATYNTVIYIVCCRTLDNMNATIFGTRFVYGLSRADCIMRILIVRVLSTIRHCAGPARV